MVHERIRCPRCDQTFGQEARFLSHLSDEHDIVDHMRLYLEIHCGGIHPTCQCSPACQDVLPWAGWRKGFVSQRVRGHASRSDAVIPSPTVRTKRQTPATSVVPRSSIAVKLAQSLRRSSSGGARRLPDPVSILSAARGLRTTQLSEEFAPDLGKLSSSEIFKDVSPIAEDRRPAAEKAKSRRRKLDVQCQSCGRPLNSKKPATSSRALDDDCCAACVDSGL